MVEGALWGSIASGTDREPFPADAEQRMLEFTELAGTAIANADSRSELTASRARVVAASDATRRQIERGLHDGAQQRLVHTVITLELAYRAFRTDSDAARTLVAEALEHAELARVELRELVQGILPPNPHAERAARGGAGAGHANAGTGRDRRDRSPLPATVEATAYFVMVEALTNVAKHSRASHASVVTRVEDSTLELLGATTVSAVLDSTAAAWSGSRIGSPSTRATSGWRAQPTAARLSSPTFPCAAGAHRDGWARLCGQGQRAVRPGSPGGARLRGADQLGQRRHRFLVAR
jgi:histidine kinase